MHTPYRDTLDVARADLAIARARRIAAIDLGRKLVPVLARRVAHSLFGLVLILAAALLVGSAVLSQTEGALTSILIVALPVATALELLTERMLIVVLDRWLRSGARRFPVGEQAGFAEKDPHACLEALQAEPCRGAGFIRVASRCETAGLTLPLTGLSLILPLSLHLIVWAIIQAGLRATGSHDARYWSDLTRFDDWIVMSMILVGTAHLALVVSVFVHVGRLRWRPLHQLPSPFTPLWVAVAASACPGIVFIFVAGAGLLPMLLSLFTGMVFIPAIFGRASRVFWAERHLITDVSEALPRVSAPPRALTS